MSETVKLRLTGDVQLKEFLEKSPPNTPREIKAVLYSFRYDNGATQLMLRNPRLQLHCDHDHGIRWFERSSELPIRERSQFAFIGYDCRDCGSRTKTFAVVVVRTAGTEYDGEIMKLGEFPPFSSPVSKRVQKLLKEGENLELYRKGTRAEAQGLGVGAASYFRRIVDNQWQLLVAELRQAAAKLGQKELEVYDLALKETQFSAAVRMLKDAIPPKLLILDGENPLTLLYQPLSVQLHELSDEECLQQAADIRLVLTAMLENIADVLNDQNELREAANRLKGIRS